MYNEMHSVGLCLVSIVNELMQLMSNVGRLSARLAGNGIMCELSLVK